MTTAMHASDATLTHIYLMNDMVLVLSLLLTCSTSINIALCLLHLGITTEMNASDADFDLCLAHL